MRRLERAGVDQSYAVTVMRWARALGCRLVMTPVGFPRLPASYYRGMVGDVLAALDDDVDEGAEVAALVQRLVALRNTCRVTQADLAKRIGTTDKNVSLIETAGSSTALVVLQRHARAIGKCSWRPAAHLAVTLEPDPV